ncbi:hypothetical protein [Variovorax saccharolyticus]|uniref:hypothetical protein n=1 Tax=Variovorax saccharolyticus TaxID=3053516 RepID=UPI002575619E|nr:hypothetical protein [Variovorax sp. J31P216]MDM0029886.1 hypothetical protein [Variovorax sp. J31P216]
MKTFEEIFSRRAWSAYLAGLLSLCEISMHTPSTSRAVGSEQGALLRGGHDRQKLSHHVPTRSQLATPAFETYLLEINPPFDHSMSMMIPADPRFITPTECWAFGALTVLFALACILN